MQCIDPSTGRCIFYIVPLYILRPYSYRAFRLLMKKYSC